MTASGDIQGLHLHFDPTSGIAGDMTVAALVDAGVPRSVVAQAVGAMRVPGLKVSFERRRRGAFVGTGFVVRSAGQRSRGDHGHGHEHRDHAEIQGLLKRSRLDAAVKRLASEIFERTGYRSLAWRSMKWALSIP
jgi:uncharacterized protein (DUF111 family)